MRDGSVYEQHGVRGLADVDSGIYVYGNKTVMPLVVRCIPKGYTRRSSGDWSGKVKTLGKVSRFRSCNKMF